jgi:hypothetical protein
MQAPQGENMEPVIRTMSTSNRIPYNNGYGDFFFGSYLYSWENNQISVDTSEEEKQELIVITGSNGVPVVELDGFQRYVYNLIFKEAEKFQD